MPSNLPLTDDEKLAIHEAGHALMFDALGIPIEFVTIDAGCAGEESSYEGCVKLVHDSNNVCDVIAGTLAGPGASFFIAGVAMDKEAILKFRSDQKKIHEIYSKEKDSGSWTNFWNTLQYFQGAWLRTWLEKHQAAVNRFAESLLESRTLSCEDLTKSLRDAWDGSKPDGTELKSEVSSIIDDLMNGNQDYQVSDQVPDNDLSMDIDSLVEWNETPEAQVAQVNADNRMQVFRLVHENHDSIEVGSVLTRTSDHSNQKIAKGIYFAVSYEDALAFSKTNHGHTYTHLLTCRLQGIEASDVVDLAAEPNLILRFKSSSKPPTSNMTGRVLNETYCQIHNKKAILWSARGWVELCVLEAFAKDVALIEAADALE